MQRGNMNEEKEITESKISEMLSNLKTTEENERGQGSMNEEKEATESEINEMLSKLETNSERRVFLASPIYRGWLRKRNQLFFEDCANIGLTQYNAQNGTNFEVDKICCEGHYFGPRAAYFHLNFIAESSDWSNDEKKRCVFFAEAVLLKDKKPVLLKDKKRVVSICCILDLVAGTDTGCRYCGDRVSHPRGCSFHGCRPT